MEEHMKCSCVPCKSRCCTQVQSLMSTELVINLHVLEMLSNIMHGFESHMLLDHTEDKSTRGKHQKRTMYQMHRNKISVAYYTT